MTEMGDILRTIAEMIGSGLTANGHDIGDAGIDLHNISFLDTDNQPSRITMSLVNVEEEKTLRYAQTQSVTFNSGSREVFTHNPVVFLNLFILFSFHRSNDENQYLSLNLLGALVRFLQNKYVFTREELNVDAPEPEAQTIPAFEKVVFELYSLSFEQMNHLWGVLGGKYIPSVMYKVRLFPIKEVPEAPSALIKRQRANLGNL